MSEPLRNRQAEVEREFRKLAIKEAWHAWGEMLTVIVLLGLAFIVLRSQYPETVYIVCGLISAIAMPYVMWAGRRK